MSILDKIKHIGLLPITALVLLFLASVFIGHEEATINITNSDALSYNVMFSEEYSLYNYHAPAQHSNLLHYPFVIIENQLTNLMGGLRSHEIIAAILMVLMNFGVLYIAHRASGKNWKITSMVAIWMAFVTLFSSIQGYVWGFSSTVTRNIEIPLLLYVILASVNAKHLRSLIIPVAVGVLVGITDMLAVYVLAFGFVTYLGVELLINRDLKSLFKENKYLISSVAAIAIFTKLAIQFISATGLIVLMDTKNDPETIGSVGALFVKAQDVVNWVFELFGADVFGKTITYVPIYIIGLVFLYFAARLFIGLTKNYKEVDITIKLMMMTVVGALLFVALYDGADRYLVYIPGIMAVVVAYALSRTSVLYNMKTRSSSVKLFRNKYAVISLIVILFIPLFYYSNKHHNLLAPTASTQIGRYQSKDYSHVLLDNNVGIMIGDYWSIYATKYHYDLRSDQDLVIVNYAKPLKNEKVSNWNSSSKGMHRAVSGTNTNTALVVTPDIGDEVDDDAIASFREQVIEKYGRYTKELIFDERVIYIYDREIRDLLVFPTGK